MNIAHPAGVRHPLPLGEHQDISHDHLSRLHLLALTSSQDSHPEDQEAIQGVQFLLRAVLLEETEPHSEQDDRQDEPAREAVVAFPWQGADGKCQPCGKEQNEDEKVGELFEE